MNKQEIEKLKEIEWELMINKTLIDGDLKNIRREIKELENE